MDEEESDRFDAIIIGAGPAGAACAYALARAGKQVLMIERADTPGAKNVTGGRFYTYALEMLDNGLTAKAEEALERKVTHEQMMMLDGERSLCIDYGDPSFAEEGKVPESYTVLRATFDEWLSGQAEEKGAMLVCGIRVDELIERDGGIVGVRAGGDEMFADIVVAADGANSLMGQKAGLIDDVRVEHMLVGAKETIALPARTIEDRFALAAGEGASRLALGGARGVNGGVFIYTNRESISFGCVLLPSVLAQKHLSVHDLLQDVKMHPAIRPLLEGGTTIEYSAHLCPEAGLKAVPEKLFRTGFLMAGDAAGFAVNQGYTVRGIDLAILSGLAAANAIISTSVPEDVGAVYTEQLDALGVHRAMQMASRFPEIEDDPRIFAIYPKLANDIFSTVYHLDPDSRRPLYPKLKACIKGDTGFGAILKDVRKIRRVLRQGDGS